MKVNIYKRDGKDTNTNYIINPEGKLICLSAHLTFGRRIKKSDKIFWLIAYDEVSRVHFYLL